MQTVDNVDNVDNLVLRAGLLVSVWTMWTMWTICFQVVHIVHKQRSVFCTGQKVWTMWTMWTTTFKSLPFALVHPYSTYLYILKVKVYYYPHCPQTAQSQAHQCLMRGQSSHFSLSTLCPHCPQIVLFDEI